MAEQEKKPTVQGEGQELDLDQLEQVTGGTIGDAQEEGTGDITDPVAQNV